MSHIEPLDARTLFSHGDTGYTPVDVKVENGTLTITGTASKDYVTVVETSKVKKSAGRIVNDYFEVWVGYDHPTKHHISKAGITAIDVRLGDGDDRGWIAANPDGCRKWTLVDGKLKNVLSGVSIFISGGAGNDDLSGTGGADVIEGNSGFDHISGFGGDDLLDGGSGNDFITAYAGNATLRGGTGDDILMRETTTRALADIGICKVIGGSGHDTYAAMRDLTPRLTDVEVKKAGTVDGNVGVLKGKKGWVIR